MNLLMDSVREGEGGKIWENGIETCKISCMKRVASPGSMHDTGCLGSLLKYQCRDFPGSPVAKTQCSQCRRPRFDLWSGN